jgi:hypothetical protein
MSFTGRSSAREVQAFAMLSCRPGAEDGREDWPRLAGDDAFIERRPEAGLFFEFARPAPAKEVDVGEGFARPEQIHRSTTHGVIRDVDPRCVLAQRTSGTFISSPLGRGATDRGRL